MPIALVVTAALGGLVGVGVRRQLAAGRWRRPDETDHRLPRWPWDIPALALLWPLLLWRLSVVDVVAAWPAFAALASAAVAMASIDLAVHRLPDLLTLGSVPLVTVLLLAASAWTGDWRRWEGVLWALIVAVPVLVLLGFGGLGMGDVKLGILLAVVLGWLGTVVALAGLFGGFIFGGLWAAVLVLSKRATGSTRIAYGPWMLLGALVAVLAVAPA